jgi:dipeptidase E
MNAAGVDEIVRLSGKADPVILFLGTGTYDHNASNDYQLQAFRSQNLSINILNVAVSDPGFKALSAAFQAADIVLVGWGNALFAVDRFLRLRIHKLMRWAMERGVVLVGGSAGAAIWFDGGHSDSRDPGSFKNPPQDLTPFQAKQWQYIRSPGLGILPGYICPHYDSHVEACPTLLEGSPVQRSQDFHRQLAHHSGETGIGIDNAAALVVRDQKYTVLTVPSYYGSVWKVIYDNSTQRILRTKMPTEGQIVNLLCPAKSIVQYSLMKAARAENPDDEVEPTWRWPLL